MKEIRKYTCTRRINKEGAKIWVVLEDGRKFYRIFKTQSLAIAYFQPLKTVAQMKVQQANGNNFSKIVFTLEEMNRKGMKNSSKNIVHQVVKDSDKFFDEGELKTKPKKATVVEKVSEKPKPKKETVVVEKPSEKPKPKKETVVVKKASEKPKQIIEEKSIQPKPIIEPESTTSWKPIENNDLIQELQKLDEAKIQEFEKKDTINITIIDEILSRKAIAEKSWQEDFDDKSEDRHIEDTIYIKEEIVKPLIINSQKINFNDSSSAETATIEGIIEQRSQEINTKNPDYGRIKEYDDYKKTQISNDSPNDSPKKLDETNDLINQTKDPKSMSNIKFWVLTILLSVLIMLIVAFLILFFMFKK